MADNSERPIIIKKKIVKAGGHHGGAWKVAYADFVTAMMAFFLLMWLLNATTEEQRKGLADYFNPSIAVHRTSGGGDGPFGGNSVTAEDTMSQTGTGATKERASIQRQARGETGVDGADSQQESLDGVADALLAQKGESSIADRLLQHVRTRRTDEGLVIEISDLPGQPLFNGSGTEPTPILLGLVAMITDTISLVENSIAIDGHLEQERISSPGSNGWRLTAARALAARDLFAGAGTRPMRFSRVTGEADREPAYPDPRDIRNRRLEIVLLNTETVSR